MKQRTISEFFEYFMSTYVTHIPNDFGKWDYEEKEWWVETHLYAEHRDKTATDLIEQCWTDAQNVYTLAYGGNNA